MQGYLFSKPLDRNELEEVTADPNAAWRLPLVDPDSWSPPAPSHDHKNGAAAAPESGTESQEKQIGRIGFRSGSVFDPDEHLYPALKVDFDDSSSSGS